MNEAMQQRMLQARIEASEGDTRRHLRIIERQIVSRAERMTVTDRVKRRQPDRVASTRTRADERLFQQHVAELTLARRGEIDALTRKLEWQELSIVALRSRHSSTAALMLRPGGHCRLAPGDRSETASLEENGRSWRANPGFAVERRPSAIAPSVCAAV